MSITTPDAFGLIVIGDEILFGKRQDRHMQHFRGFLGDRGLRLGRCWLLPDDPKVLVEHLRFSLQGDLPVFVCGGIGATPDDLTRGCAAEAAGVPLVRHVQAAQLIETRFGDSAYPTRIRMADLPQGCTLIPNPHNQIPGFSVAEHHFLPGFPELVWPMAEWVMQTYYLDASAGIEEAFVEVLNTPESQLVSLMEQLGGQFPGLKLYSLPQLQTGAGSKIELGFRGRGAAEEALEVLIQRLNELGIPYRKPLAGG
ncbi:MAG: molybdopterin-binding protein [Candidatus Thiodiazotropha sp.]